MVMNKWTKQQMAQNVADFIWDGAVINLGIGMPTLIANYLPKSKEVMIQSENGVIGVGPAPIEGDEDFDLINAGKEPITLLPGGAFFHHADSFTMMRGNHIDICVMGAYQISERGDLANWSTGAPNVIPAVGGAMDLAVGAKETWVMMEHTTKDLQPKIVHECTYPLTGLQCVKKIFTDLAVLEVRETGLHLLKSCPGVSLEEIQSLTDVRIVAGGAQ
jgi:3-oxoadipate CoA-transferase beta subunit